MKYFWGKRRGKTNPLAQHYLLYIFPILVYILLFLLFFYYFFIVDNSIHNLEFWNIFIFVSFLNRILKLLVNMISKTFFPWSNSNKQVVNGNDDLWINHIENLYTFTIDAVRIIWNYIENRRPVLLLYSLLHFIILLFDLPWYSSYMALNDFWQCNIRWRIIERYTQNLI